MRYLRFLCSHLSADIRQHPLGMLAMFGWSVLGLTLLLPTWTSDRKPWPDLMWPAELVGAVDERAGITALALGMVLSGAAFIAGQALLRRYRFANKLRFGSLWSCIGTVFYLVVAITVKAFRDPDQVAPWWPVSVVLWLAVMLLFFLATERVVRCEYGHHLDSHTRPLVDNTNLGDVCGEGDCRGRRCQQ